MPVPAPVPQALPKFTETTLGDHMGRVVLSIFTTADGVVDDPQRFTFQFVSADSMRAGLEQLRAADALLLGRITYEGFAASWPSMTDEAGFADRMNSMPKYVVSTTLARAEWNNTTVIKENVAETITKLKAETNGDILIYGSVALVRWLLRNELVDELRLVTYPVVIGGGVRLFEEAGEQKVLRLVGAQTFESGVVVLTYTPTRDKLVGWGHEPEARGGEGYERGGTRPEERSRGPSVSRLGRDDADLLQQLRRKRP
jgi:dihydrofolate reductase